MQIILFKLILFTFFPIHLCASSIWEKDYEINTPRENIFELEPNKFNQTIQVGRRHALIYPVGISQLRIPYWPLKAFFESDPQDPVRQVLYELARVVSPFSSMNEVFSWLGVHPYPTNPQIQTPNPLPRLSPLEESLPMGATLLTNQDGQGLTFGCATCHSSDLFGVKVLGLTNRFPRANEFFRQGAALAPYVNSFIFQQVLNTTEGERLMFKKAKHNLKYVGAKTPVTLGLDTSLAQVALSLAKRNQDEYATRTKFSHHFPRPNKLQTHVADSKPAVWWNLKYKNRWLSDGSIVSGNPILTNFLWNEIGRGTDLKELEKWMIESPKTIQALTAAVFASKPPRFEKFFGPDAIDLEKAKRGEAHFVVSCQKCHGTYHKAWNEADSYLMTKEQLLQTTKVVYHKKTPVKDVGTDPGRYQGMSAFADDLNRLKISKTINAVVEPQKGYVPPPLDGIWSRWPYFHNNSVPNLCALLTPAKNRPKTYWAGPSKNKQTDFDQTCVGYPLGEKTPSSWKKNPDYFYNTAKQGLSNSGHDERIFLKDGKEIYTQEEKLELIEFLKTL